MLRQRIRQVGKRALPRVAGGPEQLQRVVLDSLPFTEDTVLRGYVNGYFPMAEPTGQIRWRSPERRGVIPVDGFHVQRRLAALVRQGRFEVTFDTAFAHVVRGCADRESTWLTGDLIRVYERLHERGIAHSVEARERGELVGGVLGVSIGRAFFTESLFHRVDNASRVAFVKLGEVLAGREYLLHDVQFRSGFLAQFGCIEISADEYRQQLLHAIAAPTSFRASPATEGAG